MGLLLLWVVVACYWPVGQYGFINYDDPLYVTENHHVQGGLTLEGIRWAFEDMGSSNWHPLTWLSHMLDWELFGSDARGHHWMNVLLHGFNVVALFYLLNVLTGAFWRSAGVALFFAIHPMAVESVAWVAERKNLLSTALAWLTILSYWAYIRRPGWRRYLTLCTVYGLSLMAKPMLVTMPFVLLLLDYWPCRRLRWPQKGGLHAGGQEPLGPPSESLPLARVLLEKVPLTVLSAASMIMTVRAATEGGALKSLAHFPLGVRVANGLSAYGGYIEKLLLPRDLAVFYPHPGLLPAGETAATALLLAGLTLWAVAQVRVIPFLAVGWFWFLGTLVPVIGLVQVGMQAMADRYVYVPYVGLFIVLVWGGAEIAKRSKGGGVFWISAVCLTVLFWGVATRQQLRYWQSSKTLFAHALSVNPQNAIAHNNLAHALFQEGQWEEAVAHYEQAIRIDPRYANGHDNLGAVLARQGRTAEAMVHYRRALALSPGHAGASFHLGLALESLGRLKEADDFYERALRTDPQHFLAKRQRAIMAVTMGEYDRAVPLLKEVLLARPADGEARAALSRAVARGGGAEKRLDQKHH